jgi:hypothetical protein
MRNLTLAGTAVTVDREIEFKGPVGAAEETTNPVVSKNKLLQPRWGKLQRIQQFFVLGLCGIGTEVFSCECVNR